jgi:hypothetical protein
MKPGDTFWSAAREIMQQCHAALKPGGHAIWVVKQFVRKGALVDFPGQWLRLCEACGFSLVCRHRAMLGSEIREVTLFGDTRTQHVVRMSFFRRLHSDKVAYGRYWETLSESDKTEWTKTDGNNAKKTAWKFAGKPNLNDDVRIDWEDVVCLKRNQPWRND